MRCARTWRRTDSRAGSCRNGSRSSTRCPRPPSASSTRRCSVPDSPNEVASVPDQLSVLEDKQAITDVVHRYGYALDGRDYDLLRTCFVPDVVGNYGAGPLRGYEAIEKLCRDTLEPMSVSQHLIGNVL